MMVPVQLSLEQAELVGLDKGAHLVLAPPGSGKTEVLTRRILRLLAEADSPNSRLLALTFTKKAASEIQLRVEDSSPDSSRRSRITTFHGFCDHLLRQHGSSVGVSSRTTIYGSYEDRAEALSQGLVDEGLRPADFSEREVRQGLEQISMAKRNLESPEHSTGGFGGGDIPFGQVYAAYERSLRSNDALDFEGLLVRAHELLTTAEGIARYYRRLFPWLLVDEAQDMCSAEYEILRAFCGDSYRNIFVVADHDQSIYRFRGASSGHLDRFVNEFGASTHRLSANFRCADEVVRLSAAFLPEGNTSASSHAAARGFVDALSFVDEPAEARWIAHWIQSLLTTGLQPEWLSADEATEVAPEDIAVLARSRRLLDKVCVELGRRQIEYVLFAGNGGPFDTDVYSLVLQALRVRSNDADMAIRRSFARQLGAPTDTAVVGELALREFFSALSSSAGIIRPVLDQLAESLSDPTGLVNWFAAWTPRNAADSTEMVELMRRDSELLNERLRIFVNTTPVEDRTWQGLVRSIVELPAPDRPGIRIMTIHGAKGLEFRAVAIVGMNEGSLPDFRSVGDHADYEAERRLAYVAASRASRVAILTRPRSVETRYGKRSKQPSPFLKDANVSVTKL